MKVITKRFGKENTLKDAFILLRTFRRIRKNSLVPKGLYRFHSMEEAHQWMIQNMASTPVPRN